MIDPQVENTVAELLETIAHANKLYASLQENGVRMRFENGEEPKTKVKFIDVREISQTVTYYNKPLEF